MQTAKTRKPHKKSRSGCLPCKARHVKCDEHKPGCLNCENHGSTCEYPRLKKAAASDVARSPAALGTPCSTQSPASGRPHLVADESRELIADIVHLRLLHHYTTVTAKTLAYEQDVEEVFSCYVVKMAFDNPFLLHAILALAALHLSRLERDQTAEYLLQGERHYQMALTRFRMEVKDITESNLQCVLAFNACLFPYSCALSTRSTDPEHAFDSVFSNLLLTRKMRPMVTTAGLYTTMMNSDLGRIMPKDVHVIDWGKAEAPIETELVQLRKFAAVFHHIYPPEIIEAYKEAIRLLELLFDVMKNKLTKPPSDSLLRIWAHFIPPRFVELLSEKQPGALIIFAHYGVALGRSPHYWFLEGVDELMLAVADAFVPTEWKNWLDWPKEQIRGCHTPHSQST